LIFLKGSRRIPTYVPRHVRLGISQIGAGISAVPAVFVENADVHADAESLMEAGALIFLKAPVRQRP